MTELPPLELLKARLHYDPESGDFTWRENANSRARQGDVAGTNCNGYIRISVRGTLFAAHRLAVLYVTGLPPTDTIDHIDGNGLNNRYSNLRVCAHRENLRNQKKPASNTSGFKGVTYSKTKRKWLARVILGRKVMLVGKFTAPEAAARAYDDAAVKHFGEFAKTNKMLGLL